MWCNDKRKDDNGLLYKDFITQQIIYLSSYELIIETSCGMCGIVMSFR